jgi:23S rRNA (adenine2503-C2)-methyltransferase
MGVAIPIESVVFSRSDVQSSSELQMRPTSPRLSALGAGGQVSDGGAMPAVVDPLEKKPVRSLLAPEIEKAFAGLGQPAYRAKQVLRWLYEKRARSFEEMTDLPAALRAQLAAAFAFDELELVRKTGSQDTTQKFLFRLADANLIETVLIPASRALYGEDSDRRTLCVSTQVGCAYGCKFCASGLNGWTRNLHAGEIVEQLVKAEEVAGERVNNIVFMGMGEPLANFDNLMRAIGVINAPWGIHLGARHITVSTSGLAPRIRELADQPLQIRLAISLHGATDAVREQIMPVNRKYPLAVLLDACEYYVQRKKQYLTFEYILIDQVNDMPEQARALAIHARALRAKVNLIPYNTVEGLPWRRPDRVRQNAFLAILKRQEVAATIRTEKGADIDAACGQLRLRTLMEDNAEAEVQAQVG